MQHQQVAQVGHRPPRRHAVERLVRNGRAGIGQATEHLLDVRPAGPGHPGPGAPHLAEGRGEWRQLGPDAAGPVVEQDGQPLGQDAVAAGVPAVADPFPAAGLAGAARRACRRVGAEPPAAGRDAGSEPVSAAPGARPVGFQRVRPARAAEVALGPVRPAGDDGAAAAGAGRFRGPGGAHPSGLSRARFGRGAFRLTAPSPVAVLRRGASWALVAISSAGVQLKMSQRAASTCSDSRSGVPEASRCTWDADRSMPRSCRSGTAAAWSVRQRGSYEAMPGVGQLAQHHSG